jgi:hypothetical protein
MSTIKMYIQPRQSGKTNKIVSLFVGNIKSDLKCPMLIVKNEQHKNEILRCVGCLVSKSQYYHVYTVAEIERGEHTRVCHTDVLIDEYLCFSLEEKATIYRNFVGKHRKSNIVIYTTADRFYDKKEIEGMKLWKQIPQEFLLQWAVGMQTERFAKLFVNLISEPCCEVIPWVYEEKRKFMSENEFKLSCMGQVYK